MAVSQQIQKARKRPGGSNVGRKRKTSGAKEGPFCGPSGGAPSGSYPVTNRGQWKSAIGHSGHAPNPSGIKSCANRVARSKGWLKKQQA